MPAGRVDGAHYEIHYRRMTGWLLKPGKQVRARSVVFSAGPLGTQYLLFRLRDVTRSLPKISPKLGSNVYTNNEELLGATSRETGRDYSRGIAITSIFYANPATCIEPVRYPAGSSFMRLLTGPLVETDGSLSRRFFSSVYKIFRHPMDFLRTHILPGWAQRTTILLVMQTIDSHIRMRLGRSIWTLFRRRLVSYPDVGDTIPSRIEIGHQVVRRFGQEIHGILLGSVNEGLLNIPMTAHILGGVPFGRNDREGVIGMDCQIHNYPGLFVVDGSIMPGNPGVNPSLTITALAEYAMSGIPGKSVDGTRESLGE